MGVAKFWFGSQAPVVGGVLLRPSVSLQNPLPLSLCGTGEHDGTSLTVVRSHYVAQVKLASLVDLL